MDKVTEFINRVSTAWVTIGVLLLTVGFNNLGPVNLVELFGQDFLNATLELLGAVNIYIGFIKGRIITSADTLSTKSIDKINKSAFALNPFKCTL
jgi:hypothetical protein